MRFDVLVLGGGVVGTSLALDLALRGRSVGLIEKGAPGRETSFGNAGLIQREAVMPYPFPRDIRLLFQYALGRKPEANYHIADVLKVAPFLWRYFHASSKEGQLKTAQANLPLFAHCLTEHTRLATAAGVQDQLRPGGWLKVYRNEASLAAEIKRAEQELSRYGVSAEFHDRKGLQAKEPHLSDVVIGGIHWKDPFSLNDPEALTLGYARHFEALGGKILRGDAMSLEESRDGWSVLADGTRVSAPDCVVALGPWAPDLLRPMGYNVPMGVKRGYHVHMKPKGNAALGLPVLDADIGYLLAPMAKGIRMTSGAEFAARDSRATPLQLERVEPYAKALFPLEGRVEAMPWKGARPCMPDMLCVLGKAPRHKGLWLNFAHAHHGLTLAASCARLMGEMITGEAPFTDPKPYSLERFN
ncbi:MAG: FAD-binding oxidoreductase [Proteobacteria bacterium]|nr:FAD-binding oxidoreductase [Pseudomonadota bacterium]